MCNFGVFSLYLMDLAPTGDLQFLGGSSKVQKKVASYDSRSIENIEANIEEIQQKNIDGIKRKYLFKNN